MITTYSELKSAIENWTHRADITNYLDEFIDMAEARMNEKLRLSEMEVRATTSINSEYTAMPSGFLEMRNIQINTNPVKPLEYLSPHVIDIKSDSASGEPKYYTIIGDELQVYPVPDSSYTVEITYYKEQPALSATNTSNDILANWPYLYLHGCLYQAFMFIQDKDSASMHLGEFERLINECNNTSHRRKYSGAPMVVRAA